MLYTLTIRWSHTSLRPSGSEAYRRASFFTEKNDALRLQKRPGNHPRSGGGEPDSDWCPRIRHRWRPGLRSKANGSGGGFRSAIQGPGEHFARNQRRFDLHVRHRHHADSVLHLHHRRWPDALRLRPQQWLRRNGFGQRYTELSVERRWRHAFIRYRSCFRGNSAKDREHRIHTVSERTGIHYDFGKSNRRTRGHGFAGQHLRAGSFGERRHVGYRRLHRQRDRRGRGNQFVIAEAALVSGSSQINAAAISVVGGISITGTSTTTPAASVGTPVVADPLASLAAPTPASCATHPTLYNAPNGTSTLLPGTYCGGISVGGIANVTFSAGLYIINGGGLSFGNSAIATGNNVTFFLTGTNANYASVTASGASTVTLSGPTSGTYQGVLFYQDRSLCTVSALSRRVVRQIARPLLSQVHSIFPTTKSFFLQVRLKPQWGCTT